MHHPTAPIPASFSLARAGLGLAAVAGAGLAASVAVCLAIGRPEQVAVAATTGVLCLLASLVALAPVWMLSPRGVEGLGQGFLLGLLVRMPLCLTVAAGVGYASDFGLLSVCLWVSGWYLLLLAAEVVLMTRSLLESSRPAERVGAAEVLS